MSDTVCRSNSSPLKDGKTVAEMTKLEAIQLIWDSKMKGKNMEIGERIPLPLRLAPPVETTPIPMEPIRMPEPVKVGVGR